MKRETAGRRENSRISSTFHTWGSKKDVWKVVKRSFFCLLSPSWLLVSIKFCSHSVPNPNPRTPLTPTQRRRGHHLHPWQWQWLDHRVIRELHQLVQIPASICQPGTILEDITPSISCSILRLLSAQVLIRIRLVSGPISLCWHYVRGTESDRQHQIRGTEIEEKREK